MHENAKAWDRAHKFVPKRGVTPPSGRPCDWCGKPVEGQHYIHDACLDAERKFYLQIALD